MSVRRDTADQIRLAWPLAGFFVLFFIAPLIILILVSFHTDAGMKTYGATQWVKLLGDGFSWRVLGDTLWLGVEVTALCLVMGFALAWAYVRCPRGVQTLLIIVIVLPLLTSVVVRTFAWIVMLGRQGIINSLLQTLGVIDTPARLLYSTGGLVLALANVQLPLMTLPLITALQKLDPNLLDASEALGAGAWRTFWRITLPLALPGIVAGCLLTYAASITAFITQSLVGGGQMLFMPMYIYQQASALQNYPFAAAISILFLLAVMLCVSLFNTLGRLSRGYAQT